MTFSRFFSKYDGNGIDDTGAYQSDEFKAFVRDFKSTVRDAFPKDEYELKISGGHYDVSGFIRKGDKFVYIAYNVPRGEEPMDFSRRDASHGVLYRKAKSFKDYSGESNRFTDMYHFADDVKGLLER